MLTYQVWPGRRSVSCAKPIQIALQITVICLILALVDRSAHAEDTSLTTFQSAAARISSIQADFVQEKQLAILKQPLISLGRFRFRDPDRFRWEYESPVQSVMLMNPTGITRYIFDQDHYVKDAGMRLQGVQVVLQQMIGWLRGRFDDDADFAIDCPQPDQIVLTPRQTGMAKMITRIELTLSATPGVIDHVSIYEDQTNYTVIRFRNVRLNVDIPDSEFSAH